MGILAQGKYLGEIKQGEEHYHMFEPVSMTTEGTVKFARIGDLSEEFGSSRRYMLLEVNDEEQKLIDGYI
jgi:hypothetical protein